MANRSRQRLAQRQTASPPSLLAPRKVLRIERHVAFLGSIWFREFALDPQGLNLISIEHDVDVGWDAAKPVPILLLEAQCVPSYFRPEGFGERLQIGATPRIEEVVAQGRR
jgi:hypothetical protein